MKHKKRNVMILILLVVVIVSISSIVSASIIYQLENAKTEKKELATYRSRLIELLKVMETDKIEETEITKLGYDGEFVMGKGLKNKNGEFVLSRVSNGIYCGSGTIKTLEIKKGTCEGLKAFTETDIKEFEALITDENVGEQGSIKIDQHGNKRYAGSNPNNYVCFGNSSLDCDIHHLYRIVGLIDGNMKIIKNTSFSLDFVPWDVVPADESNGIANWDRPALLKEILNGNDFYNNKSYIDENSRKYIINATWYTGGIDDVGWQERHLTRLLSKFEDSERLTSSLGHIGLISMTDIGYASTSENCHRDNSIGTCQSNNWLIDGNDLVTITNEPKDDRWGIWVYSWSLEDIITESNYFAHSIRPALFLKEGIKIKSGKGTKENPYILS